ncbi:A24 family peptidase [Cellulomonas sp. Y8]|uniref:prepilin peptidase n=1 Tax=Cellulomonas sp. Y8 TaxID=2591145 RepID=UPI0011CA0416|nr:A24 family peptidase [Cellulomonas sp. Y8]
MILLAAPVGLLGLVLGSFLNVVVWRVPRGESVVHPPSACPRCGHAVRARDNVPVLSWLLLRARCRDCGEPISARYPAVEAVTAVAFVEVLVWQGFGWSLPAFWYLAAVSVALALIDLDVRRLPDAIVLPSYPVALALLALACWGPGSDAGGEVFLRAVLGGLAVGGAYLVIFLVYPAGMGLGDVKLAGVLGLYLGWIGWSAVLVGWFAGFLLGGLFAVVLLARRRAGRKSAIPFGPFLIAGAWVGLVAGPAVGQWYLGLLGL